MADMVAELSNFPSHAGCARQLVKLAELFFSGTPTKVQKSVAEVWILADARAPGKSKSCILIDQTDYPHTTQTVAASKTHKTLCTRSEKNKEARHDFESVMV